MRSYEMGKDMLRRPLSVESARQDGRGKQRAVPEDRKQVRPTSSMTAAEHELRQRKGMYSKPGKRPSRVKVVAAVSMQERLRQQKLELERRQAMHAWTANEGSSRRTTPRHNSGESVIGSNQGAKIDIEKLRERSRARQERLRRDSSSDLLMSSRAGPAESKVSRFGGAILSIAAQMAGGGGSAKLVATSTNATKAAAIPPATGKAFMTESELDTISISPSLKSLRSEAESTGSAGFSEMRERLENVGAAQSKLRDELSQYLQVLQGGGAEGQEATPSHSVVEFPESFDDDVKKAVRQRREELRRSFGRYIGNEAEDGRGGGCGDDNGDKRRGASVEEIKMGMEMISELDRLLSEAEDREELLKTEMGISFTRTEQAVKEDMARAKAAADPKKAAGVPSTSSSTRSSRKARKGVKSVLQEAKDGQRDCADSKDFELRNAKLAQEGVKKLTEEEDRRCDLIIAQIDAIYSPNASPCGPGDVSETKPSPERMKELLAGQGYFPSTEESEKLQEYEGCLEQLQKSRIVSSTDEHTFSTGITSMVCGVDDEDEQDKQKEKGDVLAKAREERETMAKSRSIKRALRALEDVPVGPTPRMRALWDRRLRGADHSRGGDGFSTRVSGLSMIDSKEVDEKELEHDEDDQPPLSELLEHMDPTDPRLSLFAMCGGDDLREVYNQASQASSKTEKEKLAPSSMSEALSTVITPKRLALLLENAKAEVANGDAAGDGGEDRELSRADFALAGTKDIEDVVKATTALQMRTWLLREN